MSNKVFAYTTVLTDLDCNKAQYDALENYGYDYLFEETHPNNTNSPHFLLNEMISNLNKGDTVLVYKLDCICGSIKELLVLIKRFELINVNFISIVDKINTTHKGREIFNFVTALSKLETEQVSKKIKHGLEIAKKKGRPGGRPKGMSNELKTKCSSVLQKYRNSETLIDEICKEYKVPKSTFYRYKKLYIDSIPEKQINAFDIRD